MKTTFPAQKIKNWETLSRYRAAKFKVPAKLFKFFSFDANIQKLNFRTCFSGQQSPGKADLEGLSLQLWKKSFETKGKIDDHKKMWVVIHLKSRHSDIKSEKKRSFWFDLCRKRKRIVGR